MKELRLLITLCCLLLTGFIQAQVVANAGNDTVICAGAPVILGGSPVASGGTGPYTYVWSHGATTANPTVSPTTTTSYSLTVTDMMGDTNVDVVTITVSTPILSPTINQVTCFGANNGSVCLNVVGGTVPFTYAWSPSITFNPCATNLAAGAYGVTVTDAVGCSATAMYTIVEPTAIQLSASVTNATCFGYNNGAIDLTVTGGTPLYSFNWSPVAVFEDLSNVPAGTYSVSVTDINGCTASNAYNITEPTQIQLSAVVTNTLCAGSVDGKIDLTVLGGNAPYMYQWSNGMSTEDAIGLGAATYSIIVNDNMNCSASATYTVGSAPALVVDSVTVTPVSCYGGIDGNICIYASGGVGSYTYSWNLNPPTTVINCTSGLSAGTYSVTVSDVNGCTAITHPSITQPASLTAHLQSATGGILPDTLTTIYSGGTPPYAFLGSNATTVEVMYIYGQEQASCFSAAVYDANGCTALTDTVCYDCTTPDCIWPGDADNNGVADNNDLLPIGLAYSSTGSPRFQQDILWSGRKGILWADTLPDGINYKYVDCDGNGTINADDTLAVIQNFGLTHSKNNEQREWRSGSPALLVDLIPDTTQAGDTMYANLYLGDAAITATNVYGLAFTLNYDVNVVDTSLTSMQFSNSWLGTAADKISIAKDLKQGQIKCAVTRIDHNNRSGAGQIAQAKFVITTDNINGKDLAYYGMQVWVTDLVVISNDGTELDVNEGLDSTKVEFEPTGITNLSLSSAYLKIQPNPANNTLQLNVTKELVGSHLKLADLQGRALLETPVASPTFTIETSALANGIYLVQLITKQGTLTKRLIVAH